MADWTIRLGNVRTRLPHGWKCIYRSETASIEVLPGDIPFPVQCKCIENTWILVYGNGLLECTTIFVQKKSLVEVVYEAWKKKDFSFLGDQRYPFKGVCAGLVYDMDAKVAFVFRDTLGVIPIIFIQHKDQWLCTTSPSVVGEESAQAPVNYERIADFLRFQDNYGREDFKKNTYRLLPGEYLIKSECQINFKIYWNPEDRTDIKTFDDSKVRLSESLSNVVQNIPNLERSVLTLSGGLDSGCILSHLLKSYPKETWQTYSSVAPNYPLADESHELDIWEKNPKVRIHRFNMESAWTFSEPECYRSSGFGPMFAPGMETIVHGYREVRSLFTNPQMITGYGGNFLDDITFEGTFWQLLENKDFVALWAFLKKCPKGVLKRFGLQWAGNLGCGMPRKIYRAVKEFLNWETDPQKNRELIFQRDFRREYKRQSYEPSFYWGTSKRKRYEVLSWKWEMGFRYINTTLRRSSVQWHDPLCDPQLWETCLQIPPQFFHLRGHRDLWRAALKGMMPEEVRLKAKTQRFNPLSALGLVVKNKGFVEEILSKKTWLAEDVIDMRNVRNIWKQYCESQSENSKQAPLSIYPIWRVLALQLWNSSGIA